MEHSRKRAFVTGCALGGFAGMVALVVLVIAGSWMLRDYTVGLMQDKLREPPIATGQPADLDWTVQTPSGEELYIEDLRGKAIFLTFWHPACLSCLAELPSLNALYEELKDEEDIAFVSVGLGEDAAVIEEAHSEEVQFPVYLVESPRPEMFGSNDTPITYIIAPNGTVAFKYAGAAKWDSPNVVAHIRSLAQMTPAD